MLANLKVLKWKSLIKGIVQCVKKKVGPKTDYLMKRNYSRTYFVNIPYHGSG